ncbi:hypothetical protein ACIGPN_15305 [Streptomyces afghaniensis]|uniref:hypothetical protein n=1 Tax=Streptomyces TaxID=1883 RepID=UPI001FB01C9A|nr:hypothetical protein [Streptomyces sp. HP-A2021]UOB12165.1 hypothetical protein MQE23_25260 [Streptomyces sp. HP-A2021]
MRESQQLAPGSDDLEEHPAPAAAADHERAVLVEDWLLAAAPDVQQARWEWSEGGLTLLRCGELLTAIRLPGTLVRTAAASSDPTEVGTYLAEVLDGGPVIASRGRYYPLVLPSAGVAWQHPDAECLAWGTWLGVPPVTETNCHNPMAYWAVPMRRPGELCDAEAVLHLVRLAQHRHSGQETGDGN